MATDATDDTDETTDTVSLPNGETIAYRERPGEEVPLLLLHGNASASRAWDFLFEGLPERYHCYVPDMRGFGQSSYETPIDSLSDLASDVEAFADALGLESFHLLGWSTGGGVAMRITVDAPERVRKLVLLSPVGTRGYELPALDETGQPTGELLTTREEIAASPQVAGMLDAQRTGDAAAMGAGLDAAVFNGRGTPDPDYRDAFVEDALSQRNYLDVVHALAQFNIANEHNGVRAGTGEASAIDAPTLVLWGDRDALITEERVKQTVADIGENASLVVFEDCGHALAIDAPDRFFEELLDFLE
jgi:pimeloyl-ACP methyl ester carboxylesterase